MYRGRVFPSPLVFDDDGRAQRCARFLFFLFLGLLTRRGRDGEGVTLPCCFQCERGGKTLHACFRRQWGGFSRIDVNGEGLTLPSCFRQRVGANVRPCYYYFSLGLLTLSGRVKPYTEHEKTPSLVSFHFRRCSIALQHTQSTKRHQRGVFSCSTLVPSRYSTRTRKDTPLGVFSCSALFLCPTTHAEHGKTPSLVSFHVRRLSFILYHTRRAQKCTLVGVFSCSAPF